MAEVKRAANEVVATSMGVKEKGKGMSKELMNQSGNLDHVEVGAPLEKAKDYASLAKKQIRDIEAEKDR